MNPVVEAKAWADKNTVQHARELLGQWLCVRQPDGVVRRARITETEAYDGPKDLACHASKGRTGRTEVMFGPAGRWYVYLCYGIHEMVNLVTGPEDWPAAALIRGVEGVSGPGRVTKTLGIGRWLNGTPAQSGDGSGAAAWIEAGEARVPDAEVLIGPRVGVDYAGAEWAAKPWRFRWMTRWEGKTRGGKLAANGADLSRASVSAGAASTEDAAEAEAAPKPAGVKRIRKS